jgi:putative GTP pyrophosphokinase
VALLDDFDACLPTYEHLSARLVHLIPELLASQNFRVHSVGARVKTKKSFADKIKSRPGKYKTVADVTDVCGIRIITYYEDEVETVAAIIQREFAVDAPNSVDKRKTLEVDRFGYMSLHYVAALNEARSALPEYSRCTGIRFEVQIRSILQHAWAEIEHDLKYKNPYAIPREVQRRFARLAGLLEVADSEFGGIRDAIRAYQTQVAQNIECAPEEILVNFDSLQILAGNNRTTGEIDGAIAGFMGEALQGEVSFPDSVVPLFLKTGLETIDDVERALTAEKPGLIQFAERWIRMCDEQDLIRVDGVRRGIGFYYLALFILGGEESDEAAAGILTASGFNFPDENRVTAREVRRVRATTGSAP